MHKFIPIYAYSQAISVNQRNVTMFITPVCHMTHVICHVSHVRCQVLHVTSNSQTVGARELTFLEKVHLLPSVTTHMSCVICHVSYAMCHVYFLSFVTCNFIILFILVVKLVGGGSVIKKAYPVYSQSNFINLNLFLVISIHFT